MSAVYAWPLPEANSTTVHVKFVPPVSGLPLMVGRSTNQKFSRVLNFTLGRRRCTRAVALMSPASTRVRDCMLSREVKG